MKKLILPFVFLSLAGCQTTAPRSNNPAADVWASKHIATACRNHGVYIKHTAEYMATLSQLQNNAPRAQFQYYDRLMRKETQRSPSYCSNAVVNIRTNPARYPYLGVL